jgi:hypothetical protein
MALVQARALNGRKAAGESRARRDANCRRRTGTGARRSQSVGKSLQLIDAASARSGGPPGAWDPLNGINVRATVISGWLSP